MSNPQLCNYNLSPTMQMSLEHTFDSTISKVKVWQAHTTVQSEADFTISVLKSEIQLSLN